MSEERERMNVASTGLLGTASSFLDEHFETCRPSYEAMLRSVGVRPGWRVLDAACGAGSFLPLMSKLVGPPGSIAAFDLAPDNVATVQARKAAGEFACPVEVREASLTALPYADEEFDAVWCANVLIYLDDEELNRALAEFLRVTKPNGLAAIKDPDGRLCLFSPGDPTLLWHQWEAASRVSAPFRGCLRSQTMRRWLERIGFVDVWQHGALSEIWAPLEAIQRQYIAHQLAQMGALAETADLPEADLAFWRAQRDPNALEHLVNHPDLCWSWPGCCGKWKWRILPVS
jgi:ubiquinone/menaquinone biosynthesis C-methylase UbiE